MNYSLPTYFKILFIGTDQELDKFVAKPTIERIDGYIEDIVVTPETLYVIKFSHDLHKNKLFRKLMTNGRHYKICLIVHLAEGDDYLFPPSIRGNFDCVQIPSDMDAREITKYYGPVNRHN